jgi:hypothetical protein
MSSPADEKFSISIKPVPTSRLKQLVDKRQKFWRRNWANIILITIAVLTFFATLYPDIFPKQLHGQSGSLHVPPVLVEIRNSSKKTIAVSGRGDFILWLPGLDGRHTFGKYEFHTIKDMPLHSEVIYIGPSSHVRLLAHVLNQDDFCKLLKQASCDIALMVGRASGGHKTTADLPFTEESIHKYFTYVDIGAD